MRKIFFIFLAFAPVFVFSQERKTYKGNYVYSGNNGYIEYEYIETENGRVFDGYCKFKGEFGNALSGYEEGYFKKGIKDGVWTVGWSKVKKTFINGKVNGLLEHGNTKIWYKDNHFAGSFSIGNYTGQFDSDGYADGEWISYGKDNYSGVRFKRTQKWEHGYLVSDIAYDESTGQSKDLIRFNGDERSWSTSNNQAWNKGEVWTKSDGSTYTLDYFIPSAFDSNYSIAGYLIADYFFGNYEKNRLVIKSGFRKGTIGEYAMTVFPFIAIKRPLSEYEQQRFDAKRKEEQDKKEKEEKERQEKIEQKEKEIQTAINNFENSTFGRILSDIRVRMNNGKTFEEAKQEAVFSLIAPLLVSKFEDKTAVTGLGIPLQVDYSNKDYLNVSMSLLLIDNGQGWVTREATNNGTVQFQNINSIDFRSPCIFYQSDGLIIGLDKDKDFYIAQKKDNKIKKTEKMQLLNTQAVNSGAKIKKGIYYKIERGSDSYTDLADFLKTITLEEVNTPTKTRIEKELNNTKK